MAMTKAEKEELKTEIVSAIIGQLTSLMSQETLPFTACVISHKKIEDLEGRIKEVFEDIYGNGKEGIKIAQVKQSKDIEDIKQFIESIKSYIKWFILLLMGTIITNVLQLLLK